MYKINELADQICERFKYGDIIDTEVFEDMIGYKKDTITYHYVINLLKRELARRSYVLHAITNKGYRVLFPNEVVDYVMGKHVGSSVLKLKQGLEILGYLETSTLSEKEIKILRETFDFLNDLIIYNTDSIMTQRFAINEVRRKELEANK